LNSQDRNLLMDPYPFMCVIINIKNGILTRHITYDIPKKNQTS